MFKVSKLWESDKGNTGGIVVGICGKAVVSRYCSEELQIPAFTYEIWEISIKESKLFVADLLTAID